MVDNERESLTANMVEFCCATIQAQADALPCQPRHMPSEWINHRSTKHIGKFVHADREPPKFLSAKIAIEK